MEKEFVLYEQALALKELGIDEFCFTYYLNGVIQPSLNPKDYTHFSEISEINKNMLNHEIVLAPTFSQAFRFFREKYGLVGLPTPLSTSYPSKVTHYGWTVVSDKNTDEWENEDEGFKTYEEAEVECLKKLIEIVKKFQLVAVANINN